MSSKLGINPYTSIKLLVFLILGSIMPTPAQATSLTNIPPAEQLKSNNQLFQITPENSKSFVDNPESKNQLQSRLLAEAQDAINAVEEANKFTQENIGDKTVYFYKLETTKPDFSNNVNISGANQVRWRLSTPKQVRKVPEPSTGIGLVLAFVLFAARYKARRHNNTKEYL
jgi:hypothetical protein